MSVHSVPGDHHAREAELQLLDVSFGVLDPEELQQTDVRRHRPSQPPTLWPRLKVVQRTHRQKMDMYARLLATETDHNEIRPSAIRDLQQTLTEAMAAKD